MALDRTFYQKYITGPRWQAKREAYFNLFGKYCRACRTTYGPIQLHHLTYDRLGRERWSDLMALCTKCHREVEALYRKAGRGDRTAITLAFVKGKRNGRRTK
jgi:5-methylcytosine-specific restriction endonuclease McrA